MPGSRSKSMQGGTLWRMAPDHGLLLSLPACWHHLLFPLTSGGPQEMSSALEEWTPSEQSGSRVWCATLSSNRTLRTGVSSHTETSF